MGVLAVLLLACAGTAAGATWIVDDGGADFTSIQAAADAAIAQDEPTARIDKGLLNLSDQYAEEYYDETWDLTLNQYKAWIITIAWGEGGKGSYTAHSQGAIGGDVYNHKVVGGKFRFSTGIGPFQLDIHGKNLPTIEKPNPEKAILDVLKWHYNTFEKGDRLASFSEKSDWYAVRPRKVEARWKQVTGTNWDDHKNRKADLDWEGIKSKIGEDDPLRSAVRYIGKARWNVDFTTDDPKKGTLSFNGYYDTWLITARRWDGTTVMKYYYTCDRDTGCEVWVWNNRGQENKFEYIFARDYTT